MCCSFGLPAVFLLGGLSRETEPIGMFVRSGDIVIMMGESRLAYHAVPRVFDTHTVNRSTLRPAPSDIQQRGKDRHRQAVKTVVMQSPAHDSNAAMVGTVGQQDFNTNDSANSCPSKSDNCSAILGKRKMFSKTDCMEPLDVSTAYINGSECHCACTAHLSNADSFRTACVAPNIESHLLDAVVSRTLPCEGRNCSLVTDSNDMPKHQRTGVINGTRSSCRGFSVELLNTAITEAVTRPGWEPYANYMKTARINMNIRQVFPK